jgi:polyribonucleotide nucleotidyltransferase
MMQQVETIQIDLDGKTLSIETGKLAKQANGAVLMRCGETVVLVTAVADKNPRQNIDFFPLMVEYREKAYAAGKIPGGFIKREGRLSDHEILTSRLIDRPIRPLFPEGYTNEVQIIATVLSVDLVNSPDTLAMIGASAALAISDIPFFEPIGSVRVGRIDGEFVLNPGYADLEQSDLNIVMAGTYDAVVMIEGEAKEVPEQVLTDAVTYGHRHIQTIIDGQRELQKRRGVTKQDVQSKEKDSTLDTQISSFARARIHHYLYEQGESISKELYQEKMDLTFEDTLGEFTVEDQEDFEDMSKAIAKIVHDTEKEILRANILEKGKRVDGRSLKDIRRISCEVGLLPRTHGSALFTRGETQAIVVTTLGTSMDEQRLDNLQGESTKSFMLHYNFPPFSVGETKMLRGPGRREIGHGFLAERSLAQVIPDAKTFPYTIRLVSDILESNGSSSMATVCGGTLALMDAGVPITRPVAGIAMGLVAENEKTAILSDIAGIEDHLGDMDFKVAGTDHGITAIQMDLKICGITHDIFCNALEQAREGRLFILQKINEAIQTPRQDLSQYAPRIITMQIDTEKIGKVIGPGGKVIRGIVEETGVKIDIDDDGTVNVASADQEAAQKAVKMVQDLVAEAEEGKIYLGKVKGIVDFGAFVEILPGMEGLLHISEIADYRVKKVSDELAEGDEVMVKVLSMDNRGKIKLSRKAALREEQHKKEQEE